MPPRSTKRPPKKVKPLSERIKEKTENALIAYRLYQGDPTAVPEAIFKSAKFWLEKHNALPSGMPQSKKRRIKLKRKKPQRRRRSGFMGVARFPIRRVVPYAKTSGSQHRWYFQVPLSLFDGIFKEVYHEFKITRLTIKYLPNNSTNETGLYSAVVLDRTGFGAYGAATASAWFTTIGAMPGAKIRPRYMSSTFHWYPTEPSVREWCTKDQDLVYCTIYICNNGLETEELGGMLEITGTLLSRGIYWDAKVKTVLQSNPEMFPEYSTSSRDTPSLAGLAVSTPQRSRSSSVVGGFITLH